MLTFGSLFAGAGGIDQGLEAAGLRCLWQVECDPTANSVRRRHWPDVEHVRDVAGFSRRPKRHGYWLDRYERPDVIAGGFPCQDVSVAGKRTGLAGNRSGLWWQMLRIITGMRPRYVLLENVPGLLSSDGGRDFERVVNSLVERGYSGAWRVLDARYFGVPQRRRRVFGVFASGHLGAERCAQILAVGNGLHGHPSPRGQAGEDVAFTLAASVGRSREGNRIGNAWNTNYVPGAPAVGSIAGVRRLTPRECERLMGWPDDWTRYGHDGREIADGPRYKLCGNGVVKNVAEWIARRLVAIDGDFS